jgi:hypothetical protein
MNSCHITVSRVASWDIHPLNAKPQVLGEMMVSSRILVIGCVPLMIGRRMYKVPGQRVIPPRRTGADRLKLLVSDLGRMGQVRAARKIISQMGRMRRSPRPGKQNLEVEPTKLRVDRSLLKKVAWPGIQASPLPVRSAKLRGFIVSKTLGERRSRWALWLWSRARMIKGRMHPEVVRRK